MADPRGKSSSTKKLEGNAGKRKAREDPTPDLIGKWPKATGLLARRTATANRAREIWNTEGPMLAKCGLLTVADLYSYASYCYTLALWEECAHKVRGAKLTRKVKTKAGGTYEQLANEAVQMNALAKQLHDMRKELGLTSRGRVGLQTPPPPDASTAATSTKKPPTGAKARVASIGDFRNRNK